LSVCTYTTAKTQAGPQKNFDWAAGWTQLIWKETVNARPYASMGCNCSQKSNELKQTSQIAQLFSTIGILNGLIFADSKVVALCLAKNNCKAVVLNLFPFR